jgi:hypothetical protein
MMPFFFSGPYLGIDEGLEQGSPLAGGAIVNATGRRYRLTTPGNNLDSNLALWHALLLLPPVCKGYVPVVITQQFFPEYLQLSALTHQVHIH